MRRNSLSRPWRAYEQHGVSLSELSARRSVAGRRLGYFFDRAISAASGAPGGVHSSEPVRRTFCASCGSPLTYEHRDGVGFVDVTTCSLDDPNLFPPTHHSWLSHDLAWVRFGDDLPTFQESRHDSAS